MKKLIWRITAMFWILFAIVVISFALTFYLNYERNYSLHLLDMDRNINAIGNRVDTNFGEYTRIIKSEESKLLLLLEENRELIELLNHDELGKVIEAAIPVEKELIGDERLFYVAYLKTVNTLHEMLKEVENLIQQDYGILALDFIPTYLDEQMEDEIQQKFSNLDYVIINDELTLLNETNNQEQVWTLYKGVEYDGKELGYFTLSLEVLKLEQVLSGQPAAQGLYYLNDKLYSRNKLPDEVKGKLEGVTFEEASQVLKNEGYYINRYISKKYNIKILYYEPTINLSLVTLNETLSLFEFSSILLIMLFLIVSYTLFIMVIKPCYLLVDYVSQCAHGNYNLPRKLNSMWKSSFLTVREAYLENARLVKGQSEQNQTLEVAWRRAEEASQAKTVFLAKVSHELKTPLNAIKGYAQLLKLSLDQPKQRKQLEVIEHSSDLLLKHVNELLDFSLIEERKVKLLVEKIDIFQMTATIEELFCVEMANKGLEFNVYVDGNIPYELYGDEGRIKQIVINLISNAMKFTEKGEINFMVNLEYQNEREVYLKIKVSDTGKGIAENKLDDIFEAFTQENDGISREFGGTGLGLSISKRLIEAMGGKIMVESTVNVGSTFKVFLPLSKHFVEETDS